MLRFKFFETHSLPSWYSLCKPIINKVSKLSTIVAPIPFEFEPIS
jgi:hypothetical protein